MKRIATVDAVFAACTALAEQGEAWDREDVRREIGGGSFSVIEPLIKTWQRYSEVSQALPSMRGELLLQLSDWLDDSLSQRLQALNDEWCSNIAELEASLAEQQSATEQALAQVEALQNELADNRQQLTERQYALDDAQDSNQSLRQALAQAQDEHETLIAANQDAEQAWLAQQQALQTAHAQSTASKDDLVATLRAQIAGLEQELVQQKNDYDALAQAKQQAEADLTRQQAQIQQQTIEHLNASKLLEQNSARQQQDIEHLQRALASSERERQALLHKFVLQEEEPNEVDQ